MDDDYAMDYSLKVNSNMKMSEVQCFPLYSFLVALNTTKVDYFSLDVEGPEYDVLRHIPWDKVDISVSTNLIIYVLNYGLLT